jgi:hypothetical protein
VNAVRSIAPPRMRQPGARTASQLVPKYEAEPSRAEPVKDMASEWVNFGKPGIVEVLSGIAAHVKPFHDRARTVVRRVGERHDFRERERPESVADRQSSRLRRITVSPMFEGQTPADFHTGREMGAESRPCQSGESDEGGDARELDRP